MAGILSALYIATDSVADHLPELLEGEDVCVRELADRRGSHCDDSHHFIVRHGRAQVDVIVEKLDDCYLKDRPDYLPAWVTTPEGLVLIGLHTSRPLLRFRRKPTNDEKLACDVESLLLEHAGDEIFPFGLETFAEYLQALEKKWKRR